MLQIGQQVALTYEDERGQVVTDRGQVVGIIHEWSEDWFRDGITGPLYAVRWDDLPTTPDVVPYYDLERWDVLTPLPSATTSQSSQG
jgi:hypothetical protein